MELALALISVLIASFPAPFAPIKPARSPDMARKETLESTFFAIAITRP